MDLLRECAVAFQRLLGYEYHFVIGRKGQTREFYVTFQTSDFHHIAGLHKLKDIAQIQQGMREKVFEKIISGKILQILIEKGEYYELIQGRLLLLRELENILDDNKTVFRYNEKANKFSLIKADYLLEGYIRMMPVYLFLGKRSNEEPNQMCRTFFGKGDKDYTQGQPRYTLLKKEKKDVQTGETVVQYNSLK